MPVSTTRLLTEQNAYGEAVTRHRIDLTCSRCGNTTSQEVTRPAGFGRVRPDGTEPALHRAHRWQPSVGRYHSWCHNCERAHRASGVRRPRSTGAARRPAVGAPVPMGDRRFGVEIELTFPGYTSGLQIKEALQAAGLRGWKVKRDGSLRGSGWEICSPPLRGPAGHESVRTACRVLRELGGEPDSSCGLHVHHEIRDMGIAAVKRFVRLWHKNQEAINQLVSPSRRGRSYYCHPLSADEVAYLMHAPNMEQIHQYAPNRYRAMNLRSYPRLGTVEIRQHQGTCDPEKIVNWVLLVQGMLDLALRSDDADVQDGYGNRTANGLVSTLTIGERLAEEAAEFLRRRARDLGAVAA